MLEDMQVRNLSPHTECAYVETVARFARHFGRSLSLLRVANIKRNAAARLSVDLRDE